MLDRLPVLPDYEVLGELGRGGMGRVLRALHRPTGAQRALKLLAYAGDSEALLRFRREGEALARVGGEGIVPVHEAGAEGGQAYLVLGLMDGGSLRARLKDAGRLGWREAGALVAGLARVLARCHAAGVVHRDLKPENILFDARGAAHVADFGCVRDLTASALTQSGAMLGTLVYMAPEQVDGARVGPAADVYALGVMLHELIAGEAPFGPWSSQVELMYLKAAPPPRPRLDAPPALDAVVDAAMALAPDARPGAVEVAARLEQVLLGGEMVDARRRTRWRAALAPIAVASMGAVVIAAAAVLGGREAETSGALVPAGEPSPARFGVTTTRAPTATSPALHADTVVDLSRQLRRGVDVARVFATVAPAVSTLAPLERDVLRDAALELARERTSAPGVDLERACGDALWAVVLAIELGARFESHEELQPLRQLVSRRAEARGETGLLPAALAAARAVPDRELHAELLGLADACLDPIRRLVPDGIDPFLEHMASARALEPKASLVRGRAEVVRAVRDRRPARADDALAHLARASDTGDALLREENVKGLSDAARCRVHLLSARALLMLGRIKDAVKHLEHEDVERALGPDVWALTSIHHVLRARVAVARQDPEDVVRWLRRLIAAASGRSPDLCAAAELVMQLMGAPDEAAFREAEGLLPEHY